MTFKPSPAEIERLAAQWAARRDAGLSDEETVAFSAWLDADTRHLGAYARAEAVLAQLERVGAAGGDVFRAGFSTPTPAELDHAVTRRRMVWGGSIAAGVLATGGGIAWMLPFLGREVYSTGMGETKEVVLSDGSLMTLNTASRVLVHYSKSERRIVLRSGEALFDVAKNKRRPFIVEAKDTQVRAVGTSFTVKLLPERPIQVLVREGVVEVKRPLVPQATTVKLGANTVAVAAPEAPIATEKLTSSRVTRDLAWREGRIAFDNQTLAEAAREFARYSSIRILMSANVEDQTVTGLFVANDPVGFAKAAALSLGLKAQIVNRDVVLGRPEEME
jgi:transmembrane sensor